MITLESSVKYLNWDSTKLITANKYYKRNRLIDITISRMDKEYAIQFYCPQWCNDIAADELSANHHGVSIGSVIKRYRKRKVDYYNAVAKHKRFLRNNFDWSILNHCRKDWGNI